MKKIALSSLIAALSLCTPIVGVQAEWKESSSGWVYEEKSKYVTGWKYIDSNWYYFNQEGYMQTGWTYSNGAWWYLDPTSGRLAYNTTVDGISIGNDGKANVEIDKRVINVTRLKAVYNESEKYVTAMVSNNTNDTLFIDRDFTLYKYDSINDEYNIINKAYTDDSLGVDEVLNAGEARIVKFDLSEYQLAYGHYCLAFNDGYEVQFDI